MCTSVPWLIGAIQPNYSLGEGSRDARVWFTDLSGSVGLCAGIGGCGVREKVQHAIPLAIRAQDGACSRGRKIGGERGIRTLDGLLTHTPLAGERLQPLGHLSGKRLRVSMGELRIGTREKNLFV